jgi:hypothetical protein
MAFREYWGCSDHIFVLHRMIDLSQGCCINLEVVTNRQNLVFCQVLTLGVGTTAPHNLQNPRYLMANPRDLAC